MSLRRSLHEHIGIFNPNNCQPEVCIECPGKRGVVGDLAARVALGNHYRPGSCPDGAIITDTVIEVGINQLLAGASTVVPGLAVIPPRTDKALCSREIAASGFSAELAAELRTVTYTEDYRVITSTIVGQNLQ